MLCGWSPHSSASYASTPHRAPIQGYFQAPQTPQPAHQHPPPSNSAHVRQAPPVASHINLFGGSARNQPTSHAVAGNYAAPRHELSASSMEQDANRDSHGYPDALRLAAQGADPPARGAVNGSFRILQQHARGAREASIRNTSRECTPAMSPMGSPGPSAGSPFGVAPPPSRSNLSALANEGTGPGLIFHASVAGTGHLRTLQPDPVAGGITIATTDEVVRIGSTLTGGNIGRGPGFAFASKVGPMLNFNSLAAGPGVSVSAPADGTITISSTMSGHSVATGAPIYIGQAGTILQFKGLRPGPGIRLSESPTDVTITSSIAETAVLQDGNTFDATMAIGTKDPHALVLKTNGIAAATLSATQNAAFAGEISGASTLTLGAASTKEGRIALHCPDNTNTVAIRAPDNVSSAYSIALPAAQASSPGQVLANDGAGLLFWSSPSTGKDHAPAIASAKSTLHTDSQPGAYTPTGLTATITPQFATSRVLVQVTGTILTGSTETGYLTLARGILNLASNDPITECEPAASSALAIVGGLGGGCFTPCNIHHLDAPATTRPVTYVVCVGASQGSVTWSPQGVNSTITLTEVP
jgi:hypothetical protein